jgi:hypothetical protein
MLPGPLGGGALLRPKAGPVNLISAASAVLDDALGLEAGEAHHERASHS